MPEVILNNGWIDPKIIPPPSQDYPYLTYNHFDYTSRGGSAGYYMSVQYYWGDGKWEDIEGDTVLFYKKLPPPPKGYPSVEKDE